jgi:tryptophan halogenase
MTIVGGGTAGLVSAIIHKRLNPVLDITVLESSEIGIIGVGEGSTEHWAEFMNLCEIPLSELIRETDATLKTGIKFVNWLGTNDEYFHSITPPHGSTFINGVLSWWTCIVAEGLPDTDMLPARIPVSRFWRDSPHPGTYQFHFDTVKLNRYLHKLCRQRGITFVDAVVQDVELDEQGYINSIKDTHGNSYSADFFIDASGFSRVLMEHLGTTWQDCSEYLPMNHALAFPTERQEDIPAFTTATAVNAGWMWRIPTQARFGNGYVFCDDFITKEQAHEEIETIFGRPIDIARDIKFRAGKIDKIMSKNCAAAGLAAMFVEPLEASSIGCTIQQSWALSLVLNNYYKGNTAVEDLHNKQMHKVFDNIIDFIQLHYITQRNDTDFWKNVQIKLTDFNHNTLDMMRTTGPNTQWFPDGHLMFRDKNWFMVMKGLNLLNQDSIKEIWMNQPEQARLEVAHAIQHHSMMGCPIDLTMSHRQQLEAIMQGKYD